jgi:hypothetical protein
MFFFSRIVAGGHCLLYQNLLSLATKSGPKHFQKEPTTLGPIVHLNQIVLGLDDQDPKHIKKHLGLAGQSYRKILLFVL